MTEKVYQFKVTDKSLQDFLDSQPNKSDFFRQVAQDLKDGKLVYLSESIDAKIKEAKLENLGYKNRIDKVRAIHVETFGKEPSPQAQNAITQAANNNYARPQTDTILQLDGTLRCVTCGKFIQQRAYGFEQAQDYENHVSRIHSRKLFEGERQLCLELSTT